MIRMCPHCHATAIPADTRACALCRASIRVEQIIYCTRCGVTFREGTSCACTAPTLPAPKPNADVLAEVVARANAEPVDFLARLDAAFVSIHGGSLR